MSSIPEMPKRHTNRRYGVIERPRLLQKLRGAWEHKLTLISAPPGYGKTTMAAQFADQAPPHTVAWHTIEERERDVPTLFEQAVAALETALPGISSLADTAHASTELAVLIADYLRRHLTRDIIYILDDVQNLAGAPAAEAWLRLLVTQLPPTCHLILISRILPDLPLVEMIARRQVLAIGQEELRLTSQEINEIAATILGVAPPLATVQDLMSRLEGWPAGTLLALHPLPTDLERAILHSSQGPEALFDALATHMLEAQPPEIRHFLLVSSTLHRLSPELCMSVLELADSAAMLADMQSRNLFLARASGGLVYHTLFRAFLQKWLKQHYPTLFVDLHLRAARWFEEKEQLVEAVEHYLAADQIEQVVNIAEYVARAFFSQGKVETLLSWSERLRQIRARAPRLFYHCAMVHTDRYDYAAAEEELKLARQIFSERNEASGLAETHLQQAMIHLQRGEYQEAIDWAAPMAQLKAEPLNLHGRALSTIGVAKLRLGESDLALQYLEQALASYEANADAYALSQLLQNLGVAYSRKGRLNDASACLQRVVALRRSLGSTSALALALNNLGYYYHRGSNYKQALSTLQEGLGLVVRFPNRRAETYLLWSMGDLQRDRGAFDEAAQFYQRALELLGDSEPVLRCSILTSFSILRRWQTQYADATVLADMAQALAETHQTLLEANLARAAFWIATAQKDKASEGLAHLEGIASALQTQGVKFELVQVWGFCAHAALLMADPPKVEHYLSMADHLARQVGSAQALAAEVLWTPALAALISRSAEKYPSLSHDLKALRDTLVKPPVLQSPSMKGAESITYSLRVMTLGSESITRDSKPVLMSDWRATSARELFYYLLFNGPDTREHMSLVFWPDSSTQRVRSNFHTTLYRARQALGENVIMFEDYNYKINSEVDVWCDGLEIESLGIQARLLSPHDARTEDLWRRVTTLYRGELLSSLDSDWITGRREALHELYIEALVGLGECARARNDLREALQIFRRALQLEPYREDIHRAVMICYANRGEKQKIVAHLRELRQRLSQELDAQPSPETLNLAEALLS